ncbi:ArnT family glycosyltransferase [Halpernia frigidisoli]|uniref:4-amino-4-deoxy-L-arabinose transferase n=1 Tax=Halpernia frigidisoli TaxID=1125876 RepID=A0A1I3J2V4_9FLAO|nr:glycosyltransferase family 39 protein [Halpernia frigidisoli]SFI54612.1 4-amino-4-deoxy-L-arabinose transferase [Halpernia frigidisoli]
MPFDLKLSKLEIALLCAGFFLVYFLGMFVPLMENDSAQHASMAMKMVLNNDYLHIFKGENPYLDKPQMHFWLAAFSMKLFGINAFAYRIPAVLLLFLGAFSTKKLAELLYNNKDLAIISAFVFLSAQTIILSAHDVRTDAVLTGFIAFALWQWLKFIKTRKTSAVIFAGFATAMAFSSKGLMAIVIIGACVFAYLIYSRDWKKFFNPKLFIGIFFFLVFISPVLFAFYHQFGTEGIKFILFNQSVNRLTASGFEQNNSDYFFFFHTLLWAFLPFSLLLYLGVFQQSKFFILNKFKNIKNVEFLTLGGFWLVMFIFSFSKFKLPHYLNGLIPVISILTSATLFQLFKDKKFKTIKVLWIIQIVVFLAVILIMSMLAYYFTGIFNIYFFIISTFLFCYLLYYLFKKENLFKKYAVASFIFAISVNVFLNSQFYPVLTKYQAGLKLAEFVNKSNINKDKIKMLTGNETWNVDFYTQRNTDRVAENELKKGDILLVNKEQFDSLKILFSVIRIEKDYRITRLSLKFLNPAERNSQLENMYLVKIL